ncbi:MAG: thiolase family protein [Chloroflexota bacterium]|nr:thiolase family protein [Chloroflexota bacterium]
MPEAVLAAAARSPIGRLGGGLGKLSAGALGGALAVEFWRRFSIDPKDIDETILGCVLQGGQGMNVARQVAIGAGVPADRPALTVNQVCASGLTAIELAAVQVESGRARLVLAGGVDSMSTAPHLLRRLRRGRQYGPAEVEDLILVDGLTCALEHIHMGETAEEINFEYGLSRELQDAYALQSQQRYRAAAAKLAEEILPLRSADNPEAAGLEVDELPRDSDLQGLARLRPVFAPNGSVTAGNASGLADGAALVLVAERGFAHQLGLTTLARLQGFTTVGVDPRRMGIAPAPAIRKLLREHGQSLGEIDLLEVNEAFAGQVLAVLADLGISQERVNVNGGAVALGHPLGATGARILISLVHELVRRGGGRGVAALCVGGGMGKAALVEVGAA